MRVFVRGLIVSVRGHAPGTVGRYEVSLGPRGNPWVGLWSCPIHRVHHWLRIPLTRRVW